MKILLSWLNEYGDFADVGDPASVERLCDTLTALGMEVDAVDHIGATVAGVVSARVERLEQHPDAAKVQRVYVDAGDGTPRHVWCGAFNMQPGDVVPLATLGTTMPNGVTIERRGILGIDSEGMLCAADELGLGDDHSGILILPASTPLGVPYGEVLGIEPDVLIDVDVTRNRPDCWGYVGIARDVAAQMAVELPPPDARARVRRTRAHRAGRDRRRRSVRSIHLRRDERGPGRPECRLDATTPRGRGNAPDQQRRGRFQLHHARVEPTDPCVRPRNARGWRVPDPRGEGRRAAHDARRSSTRALTSADLLICDADDRPDRHRRRHGGPRHGDQRHDDDRGARDRVVHAADGPADVGAPGPPIRGIRPLRARLRPLRDRDRARPLRRTAAAKPAPTSSSTPAWPTSAAPRCPTASVGRRSA